MTYRSYDGTQAPEDAQNTNESAPGNAAVPAAEECGRDARDPSKPATTFGWHSRGYLPHFDGDRTIQFITFRLNDSIPADVLAKYKDKLHWTEDTAPGSRKAAALRRMVEAYEDSGKGACHLIDRRIAVLVRDALSSSDGRRYNLVAWCIMPNHVHVLIEPQEAYSVTSIVHSWKSYTAHKANRLLGLAGRFWMPDYFDRYIRDRNHLAAALRYIVENPVRAGLTDNPEKWEWSDVVISYFESAPGNAAVPAAEGCGRDARDPRHPRNCPH